MTCSVAAGKSLYVANALNKVSGFSIGPTTGALTEIPGSPFSINGYPPTELDVDKAGTHLFVRASLRRARLTRKEVRNSLILASLFGGLAHEESTQLQRARSARAGFRSLRIVALCSGLDPAT